MNHRSLFRRLFLPFAALALAVLVGRITDRTTGQSLSGLRVTTIGPTRAAARTDSDGRYVFRNLRPGKYTLVIRGKGVPTVRARIALTGRKTTKNLAVCNVALDYSCSNLPQRR